MRSPRSSFADPGELKAHDIAKAAPDGAAFCCAAVFHRGIFFTASCFVARQRRRRCEDAGIDVSNRGDDVDQTFAKFQPIALSLFRFITGLLLFQYGVAKLLKFPAGTQFEKVELFSLIGAAGTIELVLGGLLMIGLFSRIVAFILSGEMAFAYFIAHFPRGFFPLLNNGTAAILFCFACLYLATSGGGPYSLDAMMGKKD
jgi:putative oxidoreductase